MHSSTKERISHFEFSQSAKNSWRKMKTLAVVLVTCRALHQAQAQSCEFGWTSIPDFGCVYFDTPDFPTFWFDAFNTCHDKGGYLVSFLFSIKSGVSIHKAVWILLTIIVPREFTWLLPYFLSKLFFYYYLSLRSQAKSSKLLWLLKLPNVA